MATKEQLVKYEQLIEYIKSLNKVAVAYSSGVDSTFLLWAARQALNDKVIAVTASSGSFPQRELTEANDFCDEHGIRHYVCVTKELEIEGFADNPANRCYLCKRVIFSSLIAVAGEQGIDIIVEGSNVDDESDYRPGFKAIDELGVKSPLRELRFTKQDIRDLSKYLELPTWNKQSFACLATRFPYGETITNEKLAMVDKGEQYLLDLGFKQVRVRIHGNVARIEVTSDQFTRIMEDDIRKGIYRNFKEFGFDYVALDMLGYRTGSMNETL